MIPTSIDGTDITGATIDGTDVQEITVDGDVVFTAGADLPTRALKHRYDADAITGLSDGNNVTQWNDTAGSNDITAPSGDEPEYKTNIQNGLPVVRFAGSQVLNGGSGITGQPDTIFVVYKVNDSGSFQTVLDSNDSSMTNRHNIVINLNSDEFVFFAGVNLQTGVYNTNYNIHGVIADGSSSEYRINGALEASGNPGSSGLQGVQIGVRSDFNFHFDGDVCEVLVYDDRLTTQEIADVELFLSAKWGISI